MTIKTCLEKKLSSHLNKKNIILTEFGRTALAVGLKALGIGKNDEVIIPSFICSVVKLAVKTIGAKPILMDVDKDTYNLNLNQVERKITDKTKAIVINHTYGCLADTAVFRKLADKHGIYLIEDCVATIGTQQTGNFGDFSIFSLYKSTLNFSGGAIATNNKELAKKCKLILRKAPKRKTNLFSKIYKILYILTASLYEAYGCRYPFYNSLKKYRRLKHKKKKKIFFNEMSFFSILLTLLQLDLIKKRIHRQKLLGFHLDKKLKNMNNVKLQKKTISSYKYYSIYIKGDREKTIKKLSENGINVLRPWSSLNKTKNSLDISKKLIVFPTIMLSKRKIEKLYRVLRTI